MVNFFVVIVSGKIVIKKLMLFFIAIFAYFICKSGGVDITIANGFSNSAVVISENT